jgi:hypothetical protein
MPIGIYEHKKGWHHTEATKQRMSLVRIGIVFSDEQIKKMSEAKKGKIGFWAGKSRPSPSLGTRQKMSTSYNRLIDRHVPRGEDHYLWKGGIEACPPYKHYRNTDYINWRKQVFERDNYTCQNCGARSGRGKAVLLHPHHIKSYTYYKELRYELTNGLTLCVECHKKIHAKNKMEVYLEQCNLQQV